jgi:hypothetical protein
MIIPKTLVVGALVASLGAGAAGVGTSFAAERESREDGMSVLARAIADRFDLDVEEVREVFEEQAEAHREDMRERRERAFETRLDGSVEAGRIDEDLAERVRDMREEMMSFMGSLDDMESDERREAMEKRMEELRDWADENGVPMRYLRFGPPPGVHGMNGMMGRGFGHMPADVMHRPDVRGRIVD